MVAKRRNIFIVFWALLFYMSAALLWWFLLLNKQNNDIKNIKLTQLNITNDSAANPINYSLQTQNINFLFQKKQRTYISEALAFFLLMSIGAVLVYRMVLSQFKLATQQHNFMMAVTHELKTPIAVAQLNLQTINKHNLPLATQQKLINNTLNETTRLDLLASNILLTSKLDGGAYLAINDEIAVDELIEETFKTNAANFTNYKFIVSKQNNCTIEVDKFLLQILVNNLISNAIKYSPVNSTITALITTNSFAITDEGVGILDADKPLVFKKFMRLGKEETRQTKGTGIGLYLSNKIVKDLKATLTITDNKPKGTIFTVKFKNQYEQ